MDILSILNLWTPFDGSAETPPPPPVPVTGAVEVSAVCTAWLRVRRAESGPGVIAEDVRAEPSIPGGIQFGKNTTPAATKLWAGTLDLSASSPVTLNLLDLSGLVGLGDTTFGHVVAIAVQINSTDHGATVGGGSNAFDPGLGSATYAIPAGQTIALCTRAVSGWVVDATHKYLVLDPGGFGVSVTVTIVGS